MYLASLKITVSLNSHFMKKYLNFVTCDWELATRKL